MTSTIADMLTRIRNAQAVNKPEVVMPCSKLKIEIGKILKAHNYIQDYEVVDDATIKNRKNLKIALKYDDKKAAIKKLKIVSTPGRRIFLSSQKLPVVLDHFGIAIISTSQGVMTNKDARKKKLGGEVICEVY